ncbi:MAG: dTDP-6-deoxy-3,4-keto-hexulose isomerase, partial [Chitinophagaceae bacterium]|nr:dTDP-6-deoxy-3,4-keto-hexulose isomerase [Chitinophagaceae bacterium]
KLYTTPLIVSFKSIDVPGKGSLIAVEGEKEIPFAIKRVYWVLDAQSEGEVRGHHAHKEGVQVVVPLQGRLKVELESQSGDTYSYELANPCEGLLVPPLFWRRISLEKEGSCLCFASKEYKEEDYIRDYSVFKK